jgi:hypothetical protein
MSSSPEYFKPHSDNEYLFCVVFEGNNLNVFNLEENVENSG